MSEQHVKLWPPQQRVLKLLFKFRFISAQLLARVLGISRPGAYDVLESLVAKKLVSKIYKAEYRIDRKPAYYFLNKQGVTIVRKLMGVKETVVHTLYKNDTATPEFIEHCISIVYCYGAISISTPPETDIFTRSEINRFKQFPKNRPDLYVRTPDGHEAMIVLAHDKLPYITNKRVDEILTHFDDEGWDGVYPRVAFVLKDDGAKNSFLYKAAKKLENMGMDQDDITILATTVAAIVISQKSAWSSVYSPKKLTELFE